MIEQIRLDILKLVHRGDKHPDKVITDAQIYEKYVTGGKVKEESQSSEKKKGFFGQKPKDDNLF